MKINFMLSGEGNTVGSFEYLLKLDKVLKEIPSMTYKIKKYV
jgi:hypothetical protein